MGDRIMNLSKILKKSLDLFLKRKQMDMLSSKTKYKDCLIANPNDHSKCEVLRKLYEIDKEAVEAVGSFLP